MVASCAAWKPWKPAGLRTAPAAQGSLSSQHLRLLHRPSIRCGSASPATDSSTRGSSTSSGGISDVNSLPSSSSSSSRSSSVPPAAARKRTACRVRPIEATDYWAAADLHACAFYPRATPFWFAALRLDRVMSLQMGSERQQGGIRFMCLVAEGPSGGGSSAASSSSSSSSSSEESSRASGSAGGGEGSGREPGALALADAAEAARAAAVQGSGSDGTSASTRGDGGGSSEVVRTFITPAGARADRVDLGPLTGGIVNTLFPPAMRQNYGTSYTTGGLCGVVVIDTFGDFVPPRRTRMPNGTMRDLPRARIAYLSNLAVAPCTRRSGVGAQLVREAEQAAAEWGCRSVALHVDPTNTPAVQMYRRAGYRRVSGQPEWQRIFEGRRRGNGLVLMVRLLPAELRALAQRRWQQQLEERRAAAAAAAQQQEGR